MIGVLAGGSLSSECRTALQIGLGIALQSTLLLGLGLLAGSLLRRRECALEPVRCIAPWANHTNTVPTSEVSPRTAAVSPRSRPAA